MTNKRSGEAKKYIPLHSQEQLKELFDYNQVTGELIWKTIHEKQKRLLGQVAGCTKSGGYIAISIDGCTYAAHRLIWMWMYGEDPKELTVDHINHDTSDNRISNLRLATRKEQNRYRRHAVGVTFRKDRGKYQARVTVNGCRKSLGFYDTAEEASTVYQIEAKKVYGDFYCAPC
jgi:hypothetical protein